MAAPPGVFPCLEPAPQNWAHSDGVKIVRRYDASCRDVGTLADVEGTSGDFGHEKRFEQGAVSLQVEEIRPGNRSAAWLAAIGSAQCEQPLLMRHERVRAEQDAFHPTENGGIGANAKREAKNREQRKARTAAEHAEAEPKILRNRLEEGQAAGFPVLFLSLLRAAKLDQGIAPSFRGGKAALEILLHREFYVRRHFRVEFAIVLRAQKKA